MNIMKEFFNSSRFVVVLIIVLILTSCASNGAYHKGSELGETAILDWSGWGSGDVLEIDGNIQTNENRAELKPGRHNMRYGGRIGTSFLLNPKMYDSYDYSATIDMRTGHTYKVMHERTYGYGSYRDYFWIEDAATGEIVAGNLPDYHRKERERSEQARLEREIKDHFETLTVSAECDDAMAQYDLGLYYLAGIPPVAEPDIVKAFVWYSLAASNGYKDAVTVKERILNDMQKEQILEADNFKTKLKETECKTNPSTQPSTSNISFGKKGNEP
jgi:Sel1 repeat